MLKSTIQKNYINLKTNQKTNENKVNVRFNNLKIPKLLLIFRTQIIFHMSKLI